VLDRSVAVGADALVLVRVFHTRSGTPLRLFDPPHAIPAATVFEAPANGVSTLRLSVLKEDRLRPRPGCGVRDLLQLAGAERAR
jgi:hypothetical protein